jgi:hypothetical protein
MLENVAADDRIECAGLEIEIQFLDIADDDPIERLARRVRSMFIQLDADDLSRLSCFERFTEPSGAATDVEHAAR